MPTWSGYDAQSFYDELIAPDGSPRPRAANLAQYLAALSPRQLKTRQDAANRAILEMGITFTVYNEGQNIDRAWPFDVIPRLIPADEWREIDLGLRQRLTALNMFIDDVYGEQRILSDGTVPREMIESSPDFRSECMGARPRHGVWAHVCGSDLVRDRDATVYVLEDNLRVPSGVSYMLENRGVTKRVFPELFQDQAIAPVDDYPSDLFDTLAALSPRPGDDPQVVVLTPGIYNSAYFEHAYLAQRMGAELVEGDDLVVGDDDRVYMRAVGGLTRVDTVYRRVNDTFLDPETFREDSILGVPGLMRAWRRGNVALANAPGAGVADDKLVYTYVPDMIRYYLGQDPIIQNVPSWRCSDSTSLDHVLENLAKLVVKPANESGGYGMLVGPHASAKEVAKFADLIRANPRNYIAQPTLALSTVPTVCAGVIEPRHVDLRPFILQAGDTAVTAGGLTRVALRRGSLVVNSSQGGGSKDTWVVYGGSS
ncbi:MAG: circularly permuted type 2 ATP-grasp protein [Myxococcales bacterium]|nr:circularly permuted type 2 ATP-grasp protein [Myxococcales bacterium]MDH3482988.1 circularly permuted type 2 ATP-grasp protein [Myxococcales bacterium]